MLVTEGRFVMKLVLFFAVLRIWIRWICKIFLLLDPDLQKYADPQIWDQGAKYQPKTARRTILL